MAGTTALVGVLIVGLLVGAGIGYAAYSIQGVRTTTLTSTTSITGVTATTTTTVSGSVQTVTSAATSTVTSTNNTVPLPALQALSLNSSKTALLVLDFTSSICYKLASCNSSLPYVVTMLTKARAANMLIIHTRVQVSPVGNVVNTTKEFDFTNDSGADKFINTQLNYDLQQAHITTLVITGTATNGAVLYTTFTANLLGYTVVVPVDCTSSASAYVQSYTLYQLLNQPGHTNPTNQPLVSKAVTISNSSLITFA
jgi:nicotinamidase-related amidase